METSQPLSIESFSYSWLANLKPSLESPGNSFRESLDEANNSFIEIDPKLSYSSRRFFRVSQAQDFDFPISQTDPPTLVHADELISNGFLVPLFVKQLKAAEAFDDASDSIHPNSPISNSDKLHSGKRLRRCRMLLSKRIFHKYLDFLIRPLCQRLRGGRRSGSRVGINDERLQEVRNWEYSADDWRRRSCCDSESSIDEAVLHCKRTIGN